MVMVCGLRRSYLEEAPGTARLPANLHCAIDQREANLSTLPFQECRAELFDANIGKD